MLIWRTLHPDALEASAMKLNSFFRFAIVGAFGFFVDVSALYTVLFLGANYLFGRVISFLVAVLFTWYFNRIFTFSSSQGSTWKELWCYFLAVSLGGLANIAVYILVVFIVSPSLFAPLIGVAVGSCVGLCINYFAAKNFVFQSRIS
jgi:putative flippase GtrA